MIQENPEARSFCDFMQLHRNILATVLLWRTCTYTNNLRSPAGGESFRTTSAWRWPEGMWLGSIRSKKLGAKTVHRGHITPTHCENDGSWLCISARRELLSLYSLAATTCLGKAMSGAFLVGNFISRVPGIGADSRRLVEHTGCDHECTRKNPRALVHPPQNK